MGSSSLFLSCDWGTTSFRLRLVDRRDGRVLETIQSADGVVSLAESVVEDQRAEHFAAFLTSRAAALLAHNGLAPEEEVACVISGMASSRLGWKELPYAPLPQPVDGSGLLGETFRVPLDGRAPLAVWLVSGIRAEADVMRGEEMEWLGLMHRLPSLAAAESALLILPGTHSKHLRLERGTLRDFSTAMTGELFATLSHTPTLRGCLRLGAAFGPESPAFLRGVRLAASPGLPKALFHLRAAHLLEGTPPEEGSAALSGLLLGAEVLQLAAGPGTRVAVAGKLAAFYQSAVRELGLGEIEAVPGGVLAEALVWGHRQWLETRGR